jgi:pilus assembly protein TadC
VNIVIAELISQQTSRFGFAWLLLAVALSLHVTDEALTDFLSVYNPAVQAIRKRVPFIPLPIFTFRVWLTGLCIGIFVAFALSFLAFRGNNLAIGMAYPVAVLMFANGLGHIVASLYRRRMMPGVYSSPLLVAASAYLFCCAQVMRHAV